MGEDIGKDGEFATVIHTPVLLRECSDLLNIRPGGRYIDCTVGTAGHAVAFLDRSSPGGRLLGIDSDPTAIDIAKNRLKPYGENAVLANENFRDLQNICARYGFHPADGILFDLGMSSLQLDDSNRGFSFRFDAPLDMRFSPTQPTTAASIVNKLSEAELAGLIEKYGEERRSRLIARNIVASRPVNTTLELVDVVKQVVGRSGRLHPATRTFQALRIAVNQELTNLEEALKQTIDLLTPGGRLAVISYHSLEDRLVKRFMHQESKGCLCPPNVPVCTCGHTTTLTLVNRKIVTPSSAERKANPRSRSAKLRVAQRL
ncbi:MAG: 16S rRNA (cytosine(1402)-N(4))-methyltransferase RsmH [Dehalococcoidia bacterium]|nr:16S rRNA (cytosine(1402)-N(4))-methyltransferase RsmH [Dehalococcoidia bacterium]